MILLAIIALFVWLFFDELHKIRIRNRQAAQAQQLKRMAEEQARQAKEQARQAREQARIDREVERQARQLEKHEREIDKLYFRIEKAEDEILHFTELAERLEEQRDAMREEIAEIDKRLAHSGGELDPLNASRDGRFCDADGAELFMDMYASTLDNQRTAKQKQTDVDKLRKRRETLQGKVIRLDNQIFNAEQRIKKANHERDAAQNQLGA